MDMIEAPLIRLVALPLLASGILAGALRLVAGPDAGRKLLTAAPGAVFLWLLAMVLGMPLFPPVPGPDALAYAVVAGLVAAVAVDLLTERGDPLGRVYHIAAILAFGAAAAAGLGGGLNVISMTVFAVWCALSFRMWRRGAGPTGATVMLAVASLGLALLATIAGAESERDLAVALAAALGGLLFWTRPAGDAAAHRPAGLALVLAAGGAFIGLVLRLAVAAPETVVAVVVLGFVFFADSAARRAVRRDSLLGPRTFPVTVAAISLLPVLLSAAVLLILLNLPVEPVVP